MLADLKGPAWPRPFGSKIQQLKNVIDVMRRMKYHPAGLNFHSVLQSHFFTFTTKPEQPYQPAMR